MVSPLLQRTNADQITCLSPSVIVEIELRGESQLTKIRICSEALIEPPVHALLETFLPDTEEFLL